MENRIIISFIALVISSIFTLIINGSLSKTYLPISSPFSPTPLVLRFAFAVGNSKSSDSSITNAKIVNELVEKGNILSNTGYYQQAIKLDDDALTIDKNNIYATNNKGMALDSLGKYQEAITWYDKVLAIDKNDTDTMLGKGLALYNLGKYQEAITWYDKVLAIDKNNPEAMDNKGLALYKLGKYQEAITWYDKVLSIYGNDTIVMNNKGVALANLGKYQEAITWYDKAIKQTQTQSTGIDMDAVSNKAFILGIQLKEYDNALSLTDHFLKKNPEHKGLLCTTAEIYNETENEAYAHYYKDRLTKLDPNYKCGLIAKVNEIEKEAFA